MAVERQLVAAERVAFNEYRLLMLAWLLFSVSDRQLKYEAVVSVRTR